MGTRNADRLWMYGGIAGAVLLLVISWFLAISPRNAESDSLGAQAEDTRTELISLKRRLSELKQQNANLGPYRQALTVNQAALPTGSGMPDFLRQLQDSVDAVDVEVTELNVTPPQPNPAVPSVVDLPISVTAGGSPANLGLFLDRLQLNQPRAVLIEAVSLGGVDEKKNRSLTVQLRAFVAKSSTPVKTAATTD